MLDPARIPDAIRSEGVASRRLFLACGSARAEFFILCTHQDRTDQPNGDGLAPLNEATLKPTNILLGKRQRG